MTTEDTIRELLRTLADMRAVTPGLEAGGFTASRCLSMHPLYHAGSYAKLEEALRDMHRLGYQQAVNGIRLRTLWWHLIQRYLMAERRRRTIVRWLPRKRGKRERVVETVMVPCFTAEYQRVPPERREECERLGIGWLAEWFRRDGTTPHLPNFEKFDDPAERVARILERAA